MANSGFVSGKDEAAVDNLLSQATDLHVLEQVAAINCSGFTDSVLPTNLETRLRRLKSLPVSSSKNIGNASSASAVSGDQKRNFPGFKRDPSVYYSFVEEDTRIFPGIKRNPSGDFSGSGPSRFARECEVLSDSGRIGSTSSRFAGEGKTFPPTTEQIPKLLLNSRIGSSPSTSIGLASSTSDQYHNQEEGPNRKSKLSWFGKLSPSRAMGCLRLKTMESSKSSDSGGDLSVEELRKKSKNVRKEMERLNRQKEKLIKKMTLLFRVPFI